MKRVAVIGLLAVALSACRPMESSNSDASSDTKPSSAEFGTPRKVDISTVEYAVSIAATLATQSEAPNVAVNELRNARHRLDMATINVKPPYPDTLWLAFRVASTERFPRTPVVLRVKVESDETVVGAFSTVLGGKTGRLTEEQTVDVLAAMEAIPETVLVHAQAEALLMPEDTDATSIDPETATVSATRAGAVMSNPVRINFLQDGDAP